MWTVSFPIILVLKRWPVKNKKTMFFKVSTFCLNFLTATSKSEKKHFVTKVWSWVSINMYTFKQEQLWRNFSKIFIHSRDIKKKVAIFAQIMKSKLFFLIFLEWINIFEKFLHGCSCWNLYILIDTHEQTSVTKVFSHFH